MLADGYPQDKTDFYLQLDRWNKRNKCRALFEHTHELNYFTTGCF